MKRRSLIALTLWLAVATAIFWIDVSSAQTSRITEAKDFKLPLFYPSTAGVQRIKTVIAGERWRFVTNGLVHLTRPGITNYRPDGTLEWIATSPECTVDINTKEARGSTNVFFRTADDRLFQTGVGFLWQQNNSVLIVSNQVRTWIDRQALTKTALTNK
jgi:hypothetical protein